MVEFSVEKVYVLPWSEEESALISLIHTQPGQRVPARRVRVGFCSLYALIRTHLIEVLRCSSRFLKLNSDK